MSLHITRIITLVFLVGYTTHIMAFDALQPLPQDPITPKENPITEAKITLGKQLFFDKRLSRDGSLSCNSCHNLSAGGDDDGAIRNISKGKLKRSAPPVWNAAYMSTNYWDARTNSLEEQAVDHLLDPNVMGMTKQLIEERLNKVQGYKTSFNKAFKHTKGVQLQQIAQAIATFERTLKTPDSPFDQFIRGNKDAISKGAQRGLKLFTDIGCLSCHFGVNFAGPAPGPALKMGDGFYELFPNHLGSEYDKKYNLTKDVGRYLITLVRTDIHMWRVPPLRNIARTAPYFHNGSVSSLEEAVRIMGWVQLKRRLDMNETNDIVAFLKTLSGKQPEITLPQLPETDGLSLIRDQ